MRADIEKRFRNEGRVPAIFEEWDQLVTSSYREPHAGWIRERWQVLWDKHIAGPNLTNTHVEDARLICSLGHTLAMHDGNYVEAERRVRIWFGHPNALRECRDRNSMREELAWTLLYQRRTHDSAEVISSILEDPCEKRGSTNRALSRNLLSGWFDELAEPDEQPDAELARLAATVLRQFRDRKRAVSHIESGDVTNGDIARYLDSTYNARD